jgi:predicted DCC family thiol-disulfide oxidoreductase YuxK
MDDYSYRTDPTIPAFPDDRPLLLFDGVCVLCTGFARFVLEADREGRFRLASAQSPLGQALYRHYGLDPVNFETNLLLIEGRAYAKSDAFIGAMSRLGLPYSLASGLRACPRMLRDLLYDPIARNRYRWFGEREACYVPAPEERERFLA